MSKITYILFLFVSITFAQTRYVSVSGAGSHDGTTEGNAYNLTEAKSASTSGTTFYVKAGNYGSGSHTFTSGTWIGYTTTINDIVASAGSTFDYGDSVNSAVMPLLDATGTGIGITISGTNITFKNFQVKDYGLGFNISGSGHIIDNIIAVDLGNQASTGYDGFGIRCTNCTNVTFTNSYVENATAESFKITGGTNNLVQYMEIRADNTTNATDYYMIMTNTTYNIAENCHVERASGLNHGGHGLTIKWNAQYNTYRNCTIVYTNIDFNFEDVQYNLAENIRMIGQGTSSAYWHTNIDTRNGANNNTFRNIYATDIYNLITWTDDNDGFTPSPDTDAVKCGYNNTYQNFIVVNVDILFIALGNTDIGGVRTAPATGNIIENFTVINYGKIGTFYNTNSGNILRNNAFKNHTGSIGINWADAVGDNMTKTTNNFDGTLNHSAYGGTTLSSGFVGTGTGVAPYRLDSGSALKDAGTASSNLSDYDDVTWGTMGIGAFEYSAGGDVTAPTVTSVTVSDILTTSARVTWYLDEGATGQLEYGTTASYGSTTTLETGYLTGHSQVISGLTASTLYHYNIIGSDVSANAIAVVDRTFTTADSPDPPAPDPPLIEGGTKSRFLKKKKF